MKLIPLGKRVIVAPHEHNGVTPSGLVLPEGAMEKPQEGKVVAVSQEFNGDGGNISEGDTVLFAKYSGTEVKIDNKKILILKRGDILAVVE